ncbi:serine/arginine repetitive matrix protein 1-like [Alexandromys fortis]|uniref:serine/arginine repetitive matrix protein 1-like n=1 Tax=Alexandromys fortis TaxID=100897 RepID=UPI002152E575|nr:serine/arginine repetitive matrix protein 1-like [Microtus fortis]
MDIFFEELVRQVLIISTSENDFFGAKFHAAQSATPHGHFTKVATDLRPESQDTSSSPGARDQNRGPRSWGSHHRPSGRRRPAVNQHSPPPAPDRAPGTPRGGAARVPTGSRLLGVKEGERQTSLRALLSCVRRSSAARLGRPDPTSRRYALPPSRPPASPSSPRPPPPSPPRRRRRRHRRRRLLFRAPLVFIESKQASWRRPPSPSHPSQRAPRSPPPRQHPGFPLADTAGRDHFASGGGGSSPFSPASRSNEPAQRAPARPPVLSSRSLCA